jgi:hypothetical protein
VWKKCLNCSLAVGKASKYCSNKCQLDYQYKEYIRRWQAGLERGRTGVTSLQLSKHIKRYLIERYGERCWQCGWDKRHPVTGKVPLEADHRNGNAEDNSESNLQLLCPNCHSLTVNFRFLNKGNGRACRRKTDLKRKEEAASSLFDKARRGGRVVNGTGL